MGEIVHSRPLTKRPQGLNLNPVFGQHYLAETPAIIQAFCFVLEGKMLGKGNDNLYNL